MEPTIPPAQRRSATAAMVVGLIADTHGHMRPGVARAFERVDLIVHAGDVGAIAVLVELAKLAPVLAVSGNVDDRSDPSLPRQRTIQIGGLSMHVSHGDEVGRPNPELLTARYDADVIVYGHTHRALVRRTDAGRLIVNPGAAGPRRFDIVPSVARLLVRDREAEVEVIPLS
jgi:putative phosphoesterase